jgi:hypothetical protein
MKPEFWLFLVLLAAASLPGEIVRSTWPSGERLIAVKVFSLRVYETENGWGVNNEDLIGRTDFSHEPLFAAILRLVVALLIIGVGVLVAYVYHRMSGGHARHADAGEAGVGAAVPGVGAENGVG